MKWTFLALLIQARLYGVQRECKNAAIFSSFGFCQNWLVLQFQICLMRFNKVIGLQFSKKSWFLFHGALKLGFLEKKQGLQPDAATFKNFHRSEFLTFGYPQGTAAFVWPIFEKLTVYFSFFFSFSCFAQAQTCVFFKNLWNSYETRSKWRFFGSISFKCEYFNAKKLRKDRPCYAASVCEVFLHSRLHFLIMIFYM